MNTEENNNESEISEEESPHYWQLWISGAKRASDRYTKASKDAWAEYKKEESEANKVDKMGRKETEAHYPIFWSSIQSIRPAYYSRTPKPVAERKFGIEDSTAKTSSIVGERFSNSLIDDTSFNETLERSRDTFVLTDKATLRVYYEEEQEIIEEEVPVTEIYADDGTKQYYDEGSASVIEGEPIQKDGQFYGVRVTEMPSRSKCCLLPVAYNEVLHTPNARCWDEIDTIAFLVPAMTRADFIKRFGQDAAQYISFGSPAHQEEDDEEKDALREVPGQFATDIWEIWCKETKTVKWVSESVKDKTLDSKPDPYGLVGFFPCAPFIIGSCPDDSMFPTPIYKQLEFKIKQLHHCEDRIRRLMKSIRRRLVVDKGNQDVIDAINGTDNEVIAAQNFAAIVENGGLQNLILTVPVQDLVAAVQEITTLKAEFKQDFYEFYGVPDIVRGASDPGDAAATQEIKGEYVSLRFKHSVKQIQRLARDGLRLLFDLAIQTYPPEQFAEAIGAEYLDEADKQALPAAYQMLRNDRARMVRIDIETDSTTYLNDIVKRQNQNNVSNLVIGGLQQVASMMSVDPQFAAVALKMLVKTMSQYTGGQEFEDDVVSAVNALSERMQQPQQPQPDPNAWRVQIEQQKLQLQKYKTDKEGYDRQVIAQQSGQVKIQELQLKAAQLEIARTELQLKVAAHGEDAQLERMRLQLDQRAQAVDEFIEMEKLQLDKAEHQLEQYRIALSEREKLIEEQRLAQKQLAEENKAFQQVARPQQPATMINISTAAPVEPEVVPVPVAVDPFNGIL